MKKFIFFEITMNTHMKIFFRNIPFLLVFLLLSCESSSDIYTLKVISIKESIKDTSHYHKNNGDKVPFLQAKDPATEVAAYEKDFSSLDKIEVFAETDSPAALALHFILMKNGIVLKEERIGQTSTTAMSRTFYYP